MKIHIIFSLFFLLFVFAGVTASAQSAAQLDDWRLVSFNFSRMNNYPLEGKELTLTIDTRGNSVYGNSGCNRFTGPFEFENAGRLKVGPVAGTLRACGPTEDRFEKLFRETLEGADSFSFENGFLTIRDDQTQNYLRFERVKKPEILTWYVNREVVDCVGAVRTKCLQVKDSKNAPWQNFFGPIDGFTFKKGRYYVIEVERTRRENPPADAAPFALRLIRIIKSAKKEKDL